MCELSGQALGRSLWTWLYPGPSGCYTGGVIQIRSVRVGPQPGIITARCQ